MGLMRLLLLFALGWFAWRLLSRALNPPTASPRGDAAGGHDYQPLTRCSVCGTHNPQPVSGAAPICERCPKH